MDRIWEARGDDQSNIPKMVRSTEACTSSLERPVEGGSAQGKVEEGGGRPQLDQTRPGRESRSKQVNLEGFHWRLGTVWRLAQPGLTPHGVRETLTGAVQKASRRRARCSWWPGRSLEPLWRVAGRDRVRSGLGLGGAGARRGTPGEILWEKESRSDRGFGLFGGKGFDQGRKEGERRR